MQRTATQFDRAVPGRESEGALHLGELSYVFGPYSGTANTDAGFGETDKRLSELIQRYWTNFARTGDPNGPGLPTWPRFGDQGYLEFLPNAQAVAKRGLRKA